MASDVIAEAKAWIEQVTGVRGKSYLDHRNMVRQLLARAEAFELLKQHEGYNFHCDCHHIPPHAWRDARILVERADRESKDE